MNGQFSDSKVEISKEKYKEIKKIAQSCYKFFKTRNALSILEKSGVECSFIALEGNLGGFTNINESSQNPLSFHVYINSKYDTYLQKIIAAHELGHVLIHPSDSLNMFEEDSNSQIKEYEANIFVLELMSQLQPLNDDYTAFASDELHAYINKRLFQSPSPY